MHDNQTVSEYEILLVFIYSPSSHYHVILISCNCYCFSYGYFQGPVISFDLQDGTVSVELALRGTPDVMDVPNITCDVTPKETDGITVRGRDVIFKSGRKPTFDVRMGDIQPETRPAEGADVRRFLSSSILRAGQTEKLASPLICSDVFEMSPCPCF
jgi:hypothetical protein